MSEFMTQGLDALQGLLSAETGDHAIERVVARKDGALVFFVSQGETSRWFRFDGSELTELFPHEDPEIPLLKGMSAEDIAALEVLAWRPLRRVTLLDRSGAGPTILKGYKRKRGGAAGENLGRLAASAARGDGLIFPEVVEFMPAKSALRMSFLPGGPLKIAVESEGVFARIGAGLAGMQEHTSTARLPEFGLPQELENLDAIAERTLRVCSVDEHWAGVREQAQGLSGGISSNPSVVVHRDLHDGQFLVAEDTIGLLDFDLMARGDSMLDLANLAAHLQLRVMQEGLGTTQEGADACEQALVGGFADTWPDSATRQFKFYQATTLLRLALVYAVRPRWRHLSTPLTALARTCCDELLRA